ncbi:hypothetical protein ABZW38_02760 [Streptomyces bacillaris]|uniref:hypothetical protein n=1 Tax=Streptomyces bacillaris TaxID=68179 RepID=UPI0010081594
MSKEALDWVWTRSASKGTARLVLLALAQDAEGPEQLVCAGGTWLMDRTNASRNGVLSALRSLQESGELAEVEGVRGHLSHPVWILPKAIGHVPAPAGPRDDGRNAARLTTVELSSCSDPESDLYWTPEEEIQRIVAERIAACVKQHTAPGESQA